MTAPAAVRVAPQTRVRRGFAVRGLVQGVGFRPFVYVLARDLGLSGEVRNDTLGVLIEVEGRAADVELFARRLTAEAPPLALVEHVDARDMALLGGTEFFIGPSTHGSDGLGIEGRGDLGRTLASPDVATCADCLRELHDPGDRRYRHPFISCTNCGPRFTIICELPYDRPSTTMGAFGMCPRCAREYADPGDRRFHAQPIACPACGPRLELLAGGGDRRTGEAALAEARRLLGAGAIVAVKGLGGYHLACDATDERAVAVLRRRKARGAKPFALMVDGLETARRVAALDDVEVDLLTGWRRPVVLVRRPADRPAGARLVLAPSVAPGAPDLGLLLPYTPLHTLLFGLPGDPPGPRALVMTSANLSGEPIVTDDGEALERLSGLADAWLRHDRPIRVPCDDSVTRVADGAELPIRRSRGYAPLPVALPVPVPPVLAVGGEVKNTCAVASGRYAWLSQHVGDMDDLATLDAFGRSAEHLQMLTGVRPDTLAADLHPGYRSTRWAERTRGARPLVRVQHHHAHIASVMAENGLDGTGQVIGIAFDGTGYGTDGAVWGGEVLVADYAGFRRLAQLAYVPLPGGDASVHRPYRMALAHLQAAGVAWTEDLPCVAACPPEERAVLAHAFATGFGCVPTSSMGRLFDAVASLAGIRHTVDYEAQGAIELEGRSRDVRGAGAYRFALGDPPPAAAGPALRLDPGPVIRAVAADVREGVAAGVIGARFHAAVTALVAEVASTARAATGLDIVALSGGVFQNALLLAGCSRALRRDGFTVLRHRAVPANDGGLALGQLMVAACSVTNAANREREEGTPDVSSRTGPDHPAL